jgi:hypothetical protein
MENKSTRGGSRPGAGIRKNPPPPTRTIAFRIPESDIAILLQAGIDNPGNFYREAGSKAIKRLKK